MAFSTTSPLPGDNETILTAKLLQLFGGSPTGGDGRPVLLRKIVQIAKNLFDGTTPSGTLLNFKDDSDDAVIYPDGGVTEVMRFTDDQADEPFLTDTVFSAWLKPTFADDTATANVALYIRPIVSGDVDPDSVVPLFIADATTGLPQLAYLKWGSDWRLYVDKGIMVADGVNIWTVVGPRQHGWTAPSGNSSKAGFDPATVTTEQLAEHVHALIDDLFTHGLIGI